MKKNININICGTIYAIDEDAYRLLENYLESMKRYFKRQEGGDEIADDIEHRVAELLWERKEQGMTVVNIETVKEIIEIIGRATEIDDEANAQERTEECGEDAENADEPQTESDRKPGFFGKLRGKINHQRLYRNGQDKMIGGVCSGLAEYFGAGDVTFWRLGTIVLAIAFFQLRYYNLPAILNFSIPLLYLTLMIVVPVAVTPEDKLRMKGREVNPQNLKEQIVGETEADGTGSAPSCGSGRRNRPGCLHILFLLFQFFLLIPVILLFIAMVIVAIATLIAICIGTSMLAPALDATLAATIDELGWPIFGSSLAGIVALGLMVWGLISLLRPSERRTSAGAIAVSVVVWAIAVGTCIAGCAYFAMKIERVKDECHKKECTRNGITLDNMQQWQRLDELGWKIRKLENVFTYNLVDYGSESPQSMPYYYLRIHRANDANPVTLAMERNERRDAGYYVLEAITDNGGDGLQMVVADAAKPQEPLAAFTSGSEGTNLQAADWQKAVELGIITAGDSTE